MNGAMRYILYILLAAIFGFWIRAGAILLYPWRTVVIHEVTIVDPDNVVIAGEPMVYQVHYTKYTDARPEINRELINHATIKMASAVGINRAGEGTVQAEVQIPAFVDSGEYRIRVTYSYTLFSFPSRRIDVIAMTPPFTVVNPRAEVDAVVLKQSGINKGNITKNTDAIIMLQKSLKQTDRKADRYDKQVK